MFGGDDGTRTRDRGFADPCLTNLATSPRKQKLIPQADMAIGYQPIVLSKSGRRDSNSQPSPWQGDVLPLNYTRRSLHFSEEHFNTGYLISQPEIDFSKTTRDSVISRSHCHYKYRSSEIHFWVHNF